MRSSNGSVTLSFQKNTVQRTPSKRCHCGAVVPLFCSRGASVNDGSSIISPVKHPRS